MNFNGFDVYEGERFAKELKRLSKKYKNIKKDCKVFVDSIKDESSLGVDMGGGLYKARIANSDKNKGKSAGYRLISYIKVTESEIWLVHIYDKSELENITENKLDEIIKKLFL